VRKFINLNAQWQFTGPDGSVSSVNVPHTWNNIDGQDGGNDYKRCVCTYEKTFSKPEYRPEDQLVYLQFQGVNSSCTVTLNGEPVCSHDGGYSTFRADITALLQDENTLVVSVDNRDNDRVYPQKADFTFYGGIYRDVDLLVVSKTHFDLDHHGGPGLAVTPTVDGENGKVRVVTYPVGDYSKVTVALTDAKGTVVARGEGTDVNMTILDVHLWDGVKDPYLYRATVTLYDGNGPVDEISCRFGVRSFRVDPKKGFFLNGRSYPLRGVSRHQDRKGLGNAITKEMHEEDMNLICEMGCNTIRLAHYQHDQYFYDLCDERGMVVWAEIPYISSHMNNGRENTISQMKELITQNYNHPSIVCWGVSNEITISTKDKADMLDNHHVLNDLCHKMDPTRFTTLACYAMCGPFNPVAHITDVVSWNLYLGWYVPGLKLNDLWVDFFHAFYPNRALGYSEYGAEGMPNLHSSTPKRGDHTEEYQALYHEYLVKFIEKRPWMWATHVWNMFDFAADARDQGGEPGMNHKGLVTFDRKTKKDSFWLYKAYWSDDPFVHICSARYVDRVESEITVKVYSNQSKVTLLCDGKEIGTQEGSRIFQFQVPLTGEHHIEAVSGDCRDSATFRKVAEANPAYKLSAKSSNSANWV
jgi:beta-galactosidase